MIQKSIYKLFLGLSLFALASCNYNNPPAPNSKVKEVKIKANTTIAQLKALYKSGATTIHDDVIVEVTMASDDSEGNLYKTCFVQDETGGMELKLAKGNLNAVYPQGSKVLLFAKNLTLGKYPKGNGQIGLGYRSLDDKYETAFVPEKLVDKAMTMLAPGNITPKAVALKDINKSMAGTLIKLENVQFKASELGQTYADPSNKEIRAYERIIVDKDANEIKLRTSPYAKFAGHKVAEGSGSITAILSYYKNTPQLYLLKHKDVQMNDKRFILPLQTSISDIQSRVKNKTVQSLIGKLLRLDKVKYESPNKLVEEQRENEKIDCSPFMQPTEGFKYLIGKLKYIDNKLTFVVDRYQSK